MIIGLSLFRLELCNPFFSKLNDHPVACPAFLRSFQGCLLVFIRLCQVVDLGLVLFLLNVHIFKILSEELFYFANSFLH
jgi:hypothetical protein